ncbi:MAG: ABC transporter ATP-binding protein [Oscillospiraceae bacterium]|nr:ABC transporter ATP-binding protein [Oscillospiraceae bacterium]
MSQLLEIRNLKLNYGFVTALKGVDLSVPEGQIVALLGANGAGKTTTLKVISGLLKPTEGQILYNGDDITGKPAHQIARRGIMQSPEGRHVLLGLTVEENLRAGSYALSRAQATKAKVNENFERVYQLFPRLKERAKQPSGTLSGGEQQMLAIGRALMGNPRLLLLDEPSLGLAPMLIRDIFSTLKTIREEGTTILIVEQNALATLKIADYAYVLELGKISMHGKAQDLLHDQRLIEAYLGG